MALSDVAREILLDPFAQFDIYDSLSFPDYLQKRQIWVTEEALETFEQEGFLQPLFRLRRPRRDDGSLAGIIISPDSLRSYLKAGFIEFPMSGDFKLWSNFKEGHERIVYPFYHPAQSFLIERFMHGITVHLTGLHKKEANWTQIGANLGERYESWKQAYLSSLPKLEKNVDLLIRLETPYRPVYRRRFRMGLVQEWEVKDWIAWKTKTFSPADILAKCRMRVEDVKNHRDSLALEAIHFDPIGSWYMLVRLIAYDKKTRLTGKALRAQDYYEYVALMNLLLEDLTGEQQREPYEIADSSDGSWKKRVYGEDFDLDNVETQRKIVNEYLATSERLFPKLILIVEGDSEETCIPPLCHEMLWPIELDATLINLRGYGGVRKLQLLLEFASKEKMKAYVIVDPHVGVKELIERMVSARLLQSDGFKIWENDFEEDNFSEEDIIGRLNELLKDRMLFISREELDGLSKVDKSLIERLREAVYKKYRVHLDDVLSKPSLSRGIIEPRLQEIRDEVAKGQYKPKLELEKVLYHVYGKVYPASVS